MTISSGSNRPKGKGFEMAKDNGKAAQLRAQREAQAEKSEGKSEPKTFAEKLTALREEQRKAAKLAEYRLAVEHVEIARKAFEHAVSKTTDEAVKAAWAELDHATSLAGSGRDDLNGVRVDGLRQRRSADQMKADAQAILKLVQDAGADGIGSTDLSTKMKEAGIESSGTLKEFVEKHTGHKLKSKGEKRSTVYYAK